MQSGKDETPPRYVARLSFTTLLTAIVVLLGAITAAYVLGVMTGRQATAPVKEAPVSSKSEEKAIEKLPEKILQPQELDYALVLRGEERKPVLEVPPLKKNVEEKPLATMPQPSDQAQAAGSEQQAALPLPAAASANVEDYVFQMAALRDAQAADQLREKLEGHGLRTRLEKSGKLLLVLVVLRGDASRAQEVMEIAGMLKLGAPLLRSRKPVGVAN